MEKDSVQAVKSANREQQKAKEQAKAEQSKLDDKKKELALLVETRNIAEKEAE